jgi:hypothetical protein
MGILSLIIVGWIIWSIYSKGVSGCLRACLLIFFGLLFLSFFIGLFVDTTIPTEDEIYISNQELADEGDIYQAKKFIRELPPACSDTKAWVKSDGTVHIDIFCQKGDDLTDGWIEIKNGELTNGD